MNWLLASGLMALSSVVLYLSARKASLLANPTEHTNLSMYIVPTILFIAMSVNQNVSLVVTPYQLTILIIFAVCFSWLGNVASLKGIENAPNPGYSLVISKSYVVMTTILAVFVFQAEITSKAIIAILMIIAGMAILSIGKPTNEKASKSWLPLSFVAFFCWGMISLTSKYLMSTGLAVLSLLVYSSSIVTAIILLEIVIKRKLTKPSRAQLGLMVLMGISATSFDYYMQVAIQLAPNIGFVNAINAGSIAIVTLAAALFFHDDLTKRKLAGVFLASAGLITLVI